MIKRQNLKVIFLVALTSLGCAIHQTAIYFRYFEWGNAKEIGVNEHQGWPEWDLPEKDSLYVDGDRTGGSFEKRWRPVVETFPDDPAIYWKYVTFREERVLPRDFRETVDRIAPENGFFDYLEAVELAAGTVKRQSIRRAPTEKNRRQWRMYSVEIVAEDRATRVVELVRNSLGKAEFHDYVMESRKGVFERLPEPVDWVTQRNRGIDFLFFRGALSPNRNLLNVFRGFAARAVANGDRKGFIEMFKLGDALLLKFVNSPVLVHSKDSALESMWDEAKFYQAGATSLGLTKMLRQLKEREQVLEPRFGFSNRHRLDEPMAHLASRHFLSIFAGDLLEGKVRLDEHRPMARTLDAFVAWQKSLQIFWVGLGLVSLLGIYCLFQSSDLKYRSRQRAGEISTFRVVVGSSILPLGIFLGIYFLKISWHTKPDPG